MLFCMKSISDQTKTWPLTIYRDMESWDPMAEAFNDDKFNKYDRGPGRNIPARGDMQRWAIP